MIANLIIAENHLKINSNFTFYLQIFTKGCRIIKVETTKMAKMLQIKPKSYKNYGILFIGLIFKHMGGSHGGNNQLKRVAANIT